jgi:hypothetical protein
MEEMILVTPISPEIPRENRPKSSKPKKRIGDMDDEIPFA